VYNDKVSEMSELLKLLDRLLDCQYMPLRQTYLPRQFKQDNLCRAELFLEQFPVETVIVGYGSEAIGD
jgi:hypothetical protein